MALFTDGLISSIEDLTGYDSQLSQTASAEDIDVTRKLALAQEALAVSLSAQLERARFSEEQCRPASRLQRVVVTPALKRWHIYHTLEMVYADAYNSQLNDRYAGKRDQYHLLALQARMQLAEVGVGMATDPVPQAATPALKAVSGAALAAGCYFVTVTWTNPSGEEGAAAVPADITLAGGTFQATPGDPPPNAAGWNVYVGSTPEQMFLQNASPLRTGDAWVQTGAPAVKGRVAGTGQEPNYLQLVSNLIQRG
jgi:hypothetical protein